MTSSSSNIRNQIMVPIGVAIIILSLIGFGATYLIQQKHYNEELNYRLKGTYELFNKLLEVQTDVLESLSITYVDNKSFSAAFLTDNRELLLDETAPVFKAIKKRFNITHFYFHKLDKTNFLRVHNPKKFGDLITRHTLDFAAKNYIPAYGLELGPLGTLTLRFVVPWQIDGKLIGFIELGKEIDQITDELKTILELDINFVVDKKYLDQENWKKGRQIMGKTGAGWDFLPNHVVISTTMSEVPKDLQQILDNPAEYHFGETFNLNCEECSYQGIIIPLSEAGIKNIGEIIVLKNFKDITSGKQLIIFLAIITLMTISILMFLLYNHLGRIESDLVLTHHNLQDEIYRHEVTEKELAVHHEQLDELVEKRTIELEKALAEVKILSGFLPICASCKDIRTDAGEWEQIETYIRDHSEAEFSHSYCPKCAQKLYSDYQKK